LKTCEACESEFLGNKFQTKCAACRLTKKKKYTLKHGSYLLAFELLLHTGVRRSDAVTMTWRQVRTDLGMVVLRTKKNGQEVMIRIHKDLLPALKSEYARQAKDGKPPKMSDCVLLNPETGRPYSRSGLNRSLGKSWQSAQHRGSQAASLPLHFCSRLLTEGAGRSQDCRIFGRHGEDCRGALLADV
jgi:integrase